MKPFERQMGFVFLLLVLLLVALIGGLWYYQQRYDTSYFTYHGFDFKRVPHGYEIALYINQRQTPNTLTLRHEPRELEEIPLDQGVLSLLQKDHLYVTINPYDNLTGVTTLAALEIDKVLDNPSLYNIPVNTTFTQPYPTGGLEVKTCSDATSDVAVLWFRVEEMTRVYQEDGCFIVAGKTEDDLPRAADRLIYALLGIMNV